MSVKSHLSSNNTLASARQVTPSEVNLILKSLNIKKAFGADKTPTKLVKLASSFLSKLLGTAINYILASSKFSDIAKVATVISIDKKTNGKYDIFICRPVSLLNYFSKVYENITKCIYNNILPFISAYRKNCNAQHVIIRTSTHIFSKEIYRVNPFTPNAPILYPLKTSETVRFSETFKVNRKGALETNGLKSAVLPKIGIHYQRPKQDSRKYPRLRTLQK